ncbi:hypothetical protein [Rubricoccus marinus]|uniref:Uncharacterized protein n=1 Tax=Rubricoccus marinus TaxID=716817 RepID=A0A259U0E3_9BACT|nr:hypothetical protein [Rubricoccus marinus]OZC03495.1 hypothetical protein BSZ36_11180 [Rubricoccus marinus]
MPTTPDPKSRARDAFADLDTPEKTAFVIEATFSTIASALRETGERLGEIITEFDPDAFFRDGTAAPAPEAPTEARRPRAKTAPAPKTETAKKAAAKKAAASKPAASKTAPKSKPASKTAGRTRKKKDGDA